MAGARAALSVDKLRQADVGDTGAVVADDVHVWVEDSGVDGLAVLGKHWQEKGDFEIAFKHEIQLLL